MPNTQSNKSVQRTLPKSLEGACAIEDLTKALYAARCRFAGTRPDAWRDVPHHVRAGLEEIAVRLLRDLTQPGTVTDPLFRVANDLARAADRRSSIIGRISESMPWGEAS